MPHHSNGRIEAAAEKASCHKRAANSCGSSYKMLRWVAFYVALAYLSQSAKGQECRLASPVQSQESRTPIHQTEAEACPVPTCYLFCLNCGIGIFKECLIFIPPIYKFWKVLSFIVIRVLIFLSMRGAMQFNLPCFYYLLTLRFITKLTALPSCPPWPGHKVGSAEVYPASSARCPGRVC